MYRTDSLHSAASIDRARTFLHDDASLQYIYLESVTGATRSASRVDVVYHLISFANRHRPPSRWA